MVNEDQLKDILGRIEGFDKSIDLENTIMESIKVQEELRERIERYKTKGLRGVIVSIVLLIVLGVVYSLPSSAPSFDSRSFEFVSIIIGLLVLMAQLELSAFQYKLNT